MRHTLEIGRRRAGLEAAVVRVNRRGGVFSNRKWRRVRANNRRRDPEVSACRATTDDEFRETFGVSSPAPLSFTHVTFEPPVVGPV